MTSDPMEVRDRFITNGVSVLILKKVTTQINKFYQLNTDFVAKRSI